MKKQKIKKFPLSKKVITGLFAGAMALSIWAPASQAATPENNRYYSIHLKADQNKVWTVYEAGTYDDAGILMRQTSSDQNRQFVFFPLDNGKYAIVNRNSGKPVKFGGRAWVAGNTKMDNFLLQKSWTGDPAEQWYLRDQGSNAYEIVNQGYGTVASYEWTGTVGLSNELVTLKESNPSDSNRVFHISGNPMGTLGYMMPNLDYGTFSLPDLPAVGTRPNAPEYNAGAGSNQHLPQTSNSVVVGTSLVPCIMVNDSQVSDYTKIHNSPYYKLVKEEYWDKAATKTVVPNTTESVSFKTGMSSTDQQKMTDTLSMQVGADLGLKFGEKTATLKGQITRTLQTEISTSDTKITEDTVTTNLGTEAGKTTEYSLYQLATKYTLYRQDGTSVSGSWTVKDNKTTVIRKNSY